MKLSKHLCVASLCATSAMVPVSGIIADDTSIDWIKDGKFILDTRYRMENISQYGYDHDATASMLRTKLGYRTAKINGFSVYAELESSFVLGSEKYNNTLNGKTHYPVIPDPESTELNQLYAHYNKDGMDVKIGRQAVNLLNTRFYGSAPWRQNDQTSDAAFLSYKVSDKLSATYGYIWNVHRIFSKDHPFGKLPTENHSIQMTYKVNDFMSISPCLYLVASEDLSAQSSKTIGVRTSGKYKNFSYEIELADQSEYANNPNDFSATYFHTSGSVNSGAFSFKAGIEILGVGNGVSLQTPFGNLHKFSGLADKFVNTPKWGLNDKYISASYTAKNIPALGKVKFSVDYHDFTSVSADKDYGTEIDWKITTKLTKNLNLLLKGAHYSANEHSKDTDKFVIQISRKF